MTTVEPERDWAEGSGIVSSVKDLAEATGEQDAGGIAAAGTAAGLDSLGLAMDPLGTLAGAGVGWAIEHISFLREPLDAMLGDPPEIEARAKSWHLLSLELTAQATAFEGAMARDVAGWEGQAADAYRLAAGRLTEALSAMSQDTAGVSETVLASAAMVGTVRSLIRDMIADWLGNLVVWLAATVLSGGTAAVAAIPSMVLEATTLALHAAETISKVVDRLDEASAALAKLVANMGGRADDLASIGSHRPGWKVAAEGVEELGDDVRVKATVESGKQAGEARGEIAEQDEETAAYR